MMTNQGSSANSANSSNTQTGGNGAGGGGGGTTGGGGGNVGSGSQSTQSNSNQQQQQQTSSILITSIPSLTATASAIAAASTSNNADNSLNKSNPNNSTALIEMIMCKLVAPFHIINDPRLLECGSSACYECIMSMKDNDRNLKCPYCNNVHKIPLDSNKLIANKNLQTFLKINIADLNQNFSKQLEDSMFALEQKMHTQNLAMENFDQYLNIVQNDVQSKIEAMKNHLEKYAEQFIENLKQIRKEVQKQWIEHSASQTNQHQTTISSTNVPTTGNILITTNQNLLNNLNQHQQQQLQLQQQTQQIQIGKDKTFQIIGIKNESLIPGNLNVLTVLNSTNNPLANHSTYQLTNTFQQAQTNTGTAPGGASNNQQTNPTSSANTVNTAATLASLQNANAQALSQQANSNNNNNTTLNQNSMNNNNNNHHHHHNNNHHHNHHNHNQHNDTTSSNANNLNKQRNNQNSNFSNSSSWNGNDDDLDDFDTEINLKPVPTNLTSSTGTTGQKRHLNKEQAQFNKFVREEVSKKFGDDFLLQHEVNQLESSIMELIKSEAIATFLPKDTTPARAWTLAKVSLRSLKRDLRRKQGLTIKKESHDGKMRNKINYSFNNHQI